MEKDWSVVRKDLEYRISGLAATIQPDTVISAYNLRELAQDLLKYARTLNDEMKIIHDKLSKLEKSAQSAGGITGGAI